MSFANFADHYWRVATRPDEVYSSARAAAGVDPYVPLDDAAYRVWCATFCERFVQENPAMEDAIRARAENEGFATPIASEEELIAVLLRLCPQASPIKAWRPDDIINAVIAIDENKANAILAASSEVQKMMFRGASLVREDNPMLVAALASQNIAMSQLTAAIAAL
jgi:hypothetical protein